MTDKIPFMTAQQAADKWGVSLRRVSKLCQEGRVPGAFKMTRIWLIPDNLEKPSDERYNENRTSVRKASRKKGGGACGTKN